jgi:DNA-binding protein YbaB
VLLDGHNDLAWLGENLPALADRIRTAIDEIRAQRFTGTALDDGVTVTVNGLGALLDITIGILAKRGTDNVTLGEAVVTAVGRAEAAAKEAMATQLATLTFDGRDLGDMSPDFLKKLTGAG